MSSSSSSMNQRPPLYISSAPPTPRREAASAEWMGQYQAGLGFQWIGGYQAALGYQGQGGAGPRGYEYEGDGGPYPSPTLDPSVQTPGGGYEGAGGRQGFFPGPYPSPTLDPSVQMPGGGYEGAGGRQGFFPGPYPSPTLDPSVQIPGGGYEGAGGRQRFFPGPYPSPTLNPSVQMSGGGRGRLHSQGDSQRQHQRHLDNDPWPNVIIPPRSGYRNRLAEEEESVRGPSFESDSLRLENERLRSELEEKKRRINKLETDLASQRMISSSLELSLRRTEISLLDTVKRSTDSINVITGMETSHNFHPRFLFGVDT